MRFPEPRATDFGPAGFVSDQPVGVVPCDRVVFAHAGEPLPHTQSEPHGGEFSGHYYSKRHYFCEAPIFVLLKVLEIVSKKGVSLSQLIKPFKRYFHSGEINFSVKNKEKVLAVFEKKYKKGRISRLDGLRVDFNNWWFLLRPSNTEPLLRLVIEAKTKELFQKKKKELVSLIKCSC